MSARPGVFITGAAKRVGAELSRHFARNGYDVGLHYHSSEAEAGALAAELTGLGAACHLFAADMQDIAGLPALMDRVKRALPHCAVLVNNASVFEPATFLQTDEVLFDRQLTVNLKAPFFLTQAFARSFGQGCVINLLDSEVEQNHGHHFAYLLSKKALAGFTEMAARQLGPQIRVNAVCPGILLPSNELDAAYIEKLSKTLPLRAIGSLEQVAQAALWLSGASVTGQMVYVDGGQHLL